MRTTLRANNSTRERSADACVTLRRKVRTTVAGVASHALDFLDGLRMLLVGRAGQAAVGLGLIALLTSSPAPAKDVFRSIRATMGGSPGAARTRVSVAIENYTTDEEARMLLQAAERGGRNAVADALRHLDKGLVSVTNAQEWRINAAHAYPDGSGRRVVIVWDRAAIRVAPALSRAGVYALMSDYFAGVEPFGVVELELDSKGTGVGQLIEGAAIRLDDHGFVEVEQYAASKQLLVEVKPEP